MVRRDPAGAHVHIDVDGPDASITADAASPSPTWRSASDWDA